MTYRFVQRNTVANRDFFSFSGPAPLSATGPVVGTGFATSLLTAAASFENLEACAYGCGGRGVGSVVGNDSVGSYLLASRSLRLRATIAIDRLYAPLAHHKPGDMLYNTILMLRLVSIINQSLIIS
jgi:hypothetical protein